MGKIRFGMASMLCLTGILILSFQCSRKKTGSSGETTDRSETQGADTSAVSIPEPEWKAALVIQADKGGGESPPEKAFHRILEEGLRNIPGIKTTFPLDRSASPEDTLPRFQLETAPIQTDSGITWEMTLRDPANNQTLWKDSAALGSGDFITPSEEAVAAVSRWVPGGSSGKAVPTEPPADIRRQYNEALSSLAAGDMASLNAGIAGLKAILRTDSGFIPAYIHLARAYLTLSRAPGEHSRLVWIRLAQDACQEALRRDPDSGEALELSGLIHLALGDWRGADSEFRKCLAVNPGRASAWYGLATILSTHGLYDPALRSYRQALELSPDLLEASIGTAMILMGKTQYREAEKTLRTAQDHHPEATLLQTLLSLDLAYQNRLGEAATLIGFALQQDSTDPLAHAVYAMILARENRKDDALAEVELEVKPRIDTNPSLSSATAAVYALLGRKGEAIQWLEQAIAQGYAEYPWLANDPHYDSLREDPRFAPVLEKCRLRWLDNRSAYRESIRMLSSL